jgi:hypothetical protein
MRADMFLELQQPVFGPRTVMESTTPRLPCQAMPQQVEAVGDDELPQADQQSFASARDDSKLDHPPSGSPLSLGVFRGEGKCARAHGARELAQGAVDTQARA